MANPPRFSTGQMILENRPGLLVEMHMLKDYKTRVTGNYEILRALLEVMNRDAAKLIALNRRPMRMRRSWVHMRWAMRSFRLRLDGAKRRRRCCFADTSTRAR